MKANNIEEYLGTLQSAMKETWKSHLKTNKYSKHIALNEFYDDVVDLVDDLIEEYQGLHGVVKNLKNVLTTDEMDARDYLNELREMTEAGKDFFEEDELKSDVDAILSLIDKTLYKLNELKESKMKSLADYLTESLLTESKLNKANFTKAIKDLDDEVKDQDLVPILKGNNFNPVWLKAATSDGWENLGVDPSGTMLSNSDKTLWSRILSDVNVKKIDDVVKWINDNIDDIRYELSDADDPFSIAMDVFPVFYNSEV